MNPTTIEWALNQDGSPGFTSNPFTGCLGPRGDGINCPYCYAKWLSNGRLKPLYLANPNVAWTYEADLPVFEAAATDNPFYPRFWPQRLQDLDVKSPRGIFLCDMSDWCAPWLPMAWKEELMAAIRRNPQHRFYLLTHQPQELPKWSPFPANCWVGVTATDIFSYEHALACLSHVKAKIKYLSIEPFLKHIDIRFFSDVAEFQIRGINWLIIGAMTGRKNDLVQLSSQYPHLTCRLPAQLY